MDWSTESKMIDSIRDKHAASEVDAPKKNEDYFKTFHQAIKETNKKQDIY